MNFKKFCGAFTALMFTSSVCSFPVLKTLALDPKVEEYVQWIIDIAADETHGYSQAARNGPDYDCSSLIYHALEKVGIHTSDFTFRTYDMHALLVPAGFSYIPWTSLKDVSNLQRGDILWQWEHTELYIGDGLEVGAHSDTPSAAYPRRSTATGDLGDEISTTPFYAGWTGIFRYDEDGEPLQNDDELGIPYPRPVNFPILMKDCQGIYVKWLQYALDNVLGYSTGNYGIDGDFGNATDSAVKKFQEDNNLIVDGEVGADTINRIVELIAEKNENPDPPENPDEGHVMTDEEGAGKTVSEGDYIIYSGLDMGYFIDTPMDNKTFEGENVQMCLENQFAPSPYDIWNLSYQGNGFYKITQKNTNMCLDVYGSALMDGANVQVWGDNDSDAQLWSVNKTDNGYTLQSKCNSYFLNVSDSAVATDTNICVSKESKENNQNFCFVPVTEERPVKDGVYKIQCACNNYFFLDADGLRGDFSDETNIQVSKDKYENFRIEYAGDGWYKIFEESSGLALDVNNPDGGVHFSENKRNVQLYGDNDERSQLWKIRYENGHYTIISALSGYSLGLAEENCFEGQNIAQVQQNGSHTQQWNFIQPFSKGDINCDNKINVADAVLMEEYLFGALELENERFVNADINSDEVVDVFDMIELRNILLG
ncbi:MAG: RICIN domain-containing protein [Ruminococcus sp.]|nr:RICIN domain-containing protein [Ruminococcus sp.]